MQVRRTGIRLTANPHKVLLRPFEPGSEGRKRKILARILALTEAEVNTELAPVLAAFQHRHRNLQQFFQQRFDQIRQFLPAALSLSSARQMLISAYFSHEYALEAAALFNPSMVWHPDPAGLPVGSHRFILSLRATGEGHISSLTFRTGVIDSSNTIALDPPSHFVGTGKISHSNPVQKSFFKAMLSESERENARVNQVLAGLANSFTWADLHHSIETNGLADEKEAGLRGVVQLAQSHYSVTFAPEVPLAERVLFPYAASERNGIEDARWVKFQVENGHSRYFATYTAYDGHAITCTLLETEDFDQFNIRPLAGPEVKNKGMALFPRLINGRYAMLARQDNENNFIMFSDRIDYWDQRKEILSPQYPWEYIQLGNCGSPIETEAGWLVLGHAVGPMRRYVLSAFLLDLHDPTRVIGRLSEPLLEPNEAERAGYVPNVVYSCGGLVHNGALILPYAMSDVATSFATVNLNDLITELLKNGN